MSFFCLFVEVLCFLWRFCVSLFVEVLCVCAGFLCVCVEIYIVFRGFVCVCGGFVFYLWRFCVFVQVFNVSLPQFNLI